jgi:hypothetical protein
VRSGSGSEPASAPSVDDPAVMCPLMRIVDQKYSSRKYGHVAMSHSLPRTDT